MAYTVTAHLSPTQARRLRGLSPGQAAQAVIEIRDGWPDGRVRVDQRPEDQRRGGGR